MKNLLENLNNMDTKNKAKVIAGGIVLLIALVFFVFRNESGESISLFGEKGNELSLTDSLNLKNGDASTLNNSVNLENLEGSINESPEKQQPVTIFLDVAGAVLRPGIVTLPEGSRVFEAIEGAGGASPQADLTYINLAEKVQDGDKIYIPNLEETAKNQELNIIGNSQNSSSSKTLYSGASVNPSNSTGIIRQVFNSSNLININTASSEELQTLTGVGPSTAEKIIKYRQTSGPFENIQDIKNVSGIGEKTFQKFMDKICTY